MLGTLLSLPSQSAIQLVGNGFHIDTWSMWLVYSWANTRRVQVALCVQMSTFGDDQVDKLDDGHVEDWLATDFEQFRSPSSDGGSGKTFEIMAVGQGKDHMSSDDGVDGNGSESEFGA